jgi:hypothetical protein
MRNILSALPFPKWALKRFALNHGVSFEYVTNFLLYPYAFWKQNAMMEA